MFSEAGNALIDQLVNVAKAQELGWKETQQHLQLLAKTQPQHAGEAFDTAVREIVYTALKFNTPFYA